MKTKIKRHSRAVLSVVLAVSMLISCLTVGLIATDAANVTDSETIGAKDDSEALGYSSAKLYYKKNNSGNWSSGSNISMNMSNNNNTGTVSVSLDASSTYYFVIVADNNDWWGNNPFNLSTTTSVTKTLGSYSNFSSGNNISQNPNTLQTSTSGSYTFSITLGSGSCTVSGGTGSSSCSTNKTYRVVGTAGIAGTAWSNTATANNMSYDSSIGCYKKTYSNVAAGTHDFRIIEGSTWSQDWGFSQANAKVDNSNIVTSWSVKPGTDGDNNIRMVTSQKANVEIRLDDSKSSSTTPKAITVIVTPAIITVNAGDAYVNNSVNNDAGSITVNDGSSVTNITSDGTVTAKAVANYHWHFVSWREAEGLTFDNSNRATATVTVTGSATVDANFAKDKYTVTKVNGSNSTVSTDKTSVEWGDTVTVTTTPASGYYVTGVTCTYVDGNGETQNVTVSNPSTNTYTFTMPQYNVTVTSTDDRLANNTVTFGVNNDSYGYVSVGKQHGSTQNQIEESYSSPKTNVIQGTKINFCAIPQKGYKFVGWYTNPGCTTSATGSYGITAAQQTTKDITVTMPATAVTLYAKFEQGTDSAYSSTGVRLLFKKSDYENTSYYLYAWTTSGSTDTPQNGNWPGGLIKNLTEVTSANGTVYYTFYYNTTTLKYIMNTGSGGKQTSDLSASTGTYTVEYSGDTSATPSTYTSQAGNATTDVYPVFLEVTNPEDDYNGDGTATYAPAYATKSTTFTVNHKPDDDHKINLSKTGYTGNAGTNSTTLTMTSAYSSDNKVTVTYDEKQYYPVTFSAGPNGSLKAWINNSNEASGDEIKSGTLVKEGEKVYFKATPKNSSYTIDSWTGSITATSGTTKNLTVDGTETVKVYFKYNNDGTAVSGPYFAYSTSNRFTGYTSSNTHPVYYKNGRAYGYIDNPGTTKYYFTIATTSNPSTTNDKGNGRGCWTYNKSGLKCVTDFDQYVDVKVGNYQYNSGTTYDGYTMTETWTEYHGEAQAVSGVSRLIVDLGNWNGSTISMDYDTFRVIPVYDTDNTNIDVYAKKGSYRGNDSYDYFPGIVDSSTLTITSATGAATNIKHHAKFATGCAKPGDTVNFSVTINSGHKDAFYIRGFSINGVTPALYDWNNTGTYSVEYVIPANFNYDYLEITPIYYYKHTNSGDFVDDNFVQFYIENYDKALEATGWGNTLSVYPYYQDTSGNYVKSKQNAFGGYPGQPVIYYGGRRFIEIPTHYTTFIVDNPELTTQVTCEIKGVTLSNDYWDIVHREYCHEVDEHKQTYDYDDFYKIFKETHDGKEVNDDDSLPAAQRRNHTADQITFAFKYRTTTDNFSDNTDTHTESNYAAGSTSGEIPNTYDEFTLAEKDSKFGNGWEALLDYMDRPIDIFGKQLTTEEQEQEPLLIVSDDYRITYAGYYATTWTIYKKNAAGTGYEQIAEIAPSALIVTSKGRLANNSPYPAVADQYNITQTKLSDYIDEYEALEAYRGYPAQITYEKSIRNNSGTTKYFNVAYTEDGQTKYKSSEDAVRNDGRWYYSYYNDTIHANIRIEYSDDGSDGSWRTDPFKGDSNQGTVTGGKAYFTNDTPLNNANQSFKNKTETGDVTSNQNDFYEFAAEAAPGYVFAGWWFEKDGIVTDVNPNHSQLTGHSQMTSNATFVARYVKSPTGNLTVNHTLDPSTVGSGTTYVAVKAINKSTGVEKWLTGAGTDADHFTENQYVVDSTYIGYKSGYRFEITLKTVNASDFDVFDRFTAADDEFSQTYFSSGDTTDPSDDNITYSNTFTVDVDDMFHINNKGYPQQTFDTLTYFSALEEQNIAYKLEYKYSSMVGDNSYYGTQSYKVEGTFTREEFTKYLTYNASLQTNDSDVGWYQLNSSAAEFLANKSPHEADIRHTLTWDFRDSLGTVSYFKHNTSNGWDGQITVTKEATDVPNSTRRLQFIMPYRATNTNDGTVAEKTDGKVIELADDQPSSTTIDGKRYSKYLTKNDLAYATPYTLSDSGDPIYVTAEPVIYDKNDNTKAKYFQYWQVYAIPDGVNMTTAPTAAEIEEMQATYVQHKIAKCYNLGFNFSVYQNYVVIPVYGDKQSDREHQDEASITWAENGRNQWNELAGTASWSFGDRIFSDFMVTYDRADKLMLNSLSASNHTVTTGLITEKLDTILDANATSTNDAGTWKVQSEKYYSDLYADRDSSKTEINAYIRGRAENLSEGIVGYTGMTYNSAQSKFVLGDANVYENSFINMTKLDNKNRIEFTKVVPKLSQRDKSDTGRKDYVYRAYAYMIDWNVDGSGNPTTIKSVQISAPVYYTIYNIATIENGKGMSKYTAN